MVICEFNDALLWLCVIVVSLLANDIVETLTGIRLPLLLLLLLYTSEKLLCNFLLGSLGGDIRLAVAIILFKDDIDFDCVILVFL